MSFKQFNLHMQIEKGIEALGYTAPTPIQLQAMPAVLQGRDVMGLAQTGTGKTAAFALPILQRLMSGQRKRLRALIVAPTRELAEQIHEAIDGLGRATKLKSVAVYGGVNKNPQIRTLRQGVEIAVACPGRLLDLVEEWKAQVARDQRDQRINRSRVVGAIFVQDFHEMRARQQRHRLPIFQQVEHIGW